jgi:hypothetical protein
MTYYRVNEPAKKLCKHCAFFVKRGTEPTCAQFVHAVHGTPPRAVYARENASMCGAAGLFFEPIKQQE